MRDNQTPLETLRRLDRQRLIFALLFFLGTFFAAIGWFVDWKNLDRLPFLFKHSAMIALVGHALQVIGAFGGLLTPEYVEEDRKDSNN